MYIYIAKTKCILTTTKTKCINTKKIYIIYIDTATTKCLLTTHFCLHIQHLLHLSANRDTNALKSIGIPFAISYELTSHS